MRLTRAMSTVLLVLGCNSGSVNVQKIDPGDECPTGGVRITSGNSVQVVCNGADGKNGQNGQNGQSGQNGTDGMNGQNGMTGQNGTNGTNGLQSLIRQTRLSPGDPRCAFGGVVVAVGLDSGADGGVRGDGVLQPQEVTSEEVVCANDDRYVQSLTAPPGDAGTAVIRLNAGRGSFDAGTNQRTGGWLTMSAGETNGGHLAIWSTGSVHPAPAWGTSLARPNAQPRLRIQQSNMVFPTSEVGLPAGSIFVYDSTLSVAQGDGGPSVMVESLIIDPGVTFTLPGNEGRLQVGECQIGGSVVHGSAISLNCRRSFELLPTGSIGALPDASVAVPITLRSQGMFRASGRIDTGVSTQGDAGPGRVSILADRVLLEGTITARGAPFGPVEVASGGSVTLEADLLQVSGTIDVLSGVPTIRSSLQRPNLANVMLSARSSVIVTGRIVASGSDLPVGTCAQCVGMNGGLVRVLSRDWISLTGTLDARGGSAADYIGGSGGRVEVVVTRGSRGIESSMNIDLSGGDGVVGGEGGFARFELVEPVPMGPGITFFGTSLVEARGADARNPGNAGGVTLSFLASETPSGLRGGAAIIGAPIDLLSGRGLPDARPTTSSLSEVSIDLLEGAPAPWEKVILAAPIRLVSRGGLGSRSPGLRVSAPGDVDVLSSIDARSDATDGIGGMVSIVVGGRVLVSGNVDLSSQLGWYALGGRLDIEGRSVVVSGSVTARGGSIAGGGSVRLTSWTTPTRVLAPAPQGIDVSPYVPARSDGVLIDLVDVTGNWTH